MRPSIIVWKNSLQELLSYYEQKKKSIKWFFPKLFGFFCVVNIVCFWWAMFTAFPQLTHGQAGRHYFKIQFPVGLLGALFDSLSFFVTILIIKRALKSPGTWRYLAHLSLDGIIAAAATFWVLLVFSVSGWIISLVESKPQLLSDRTSQYQDMLIVALQNPGTSIENIYFGLIMGISSCLPTCIHLWLFIRAIFRHLPKNI